MRANKTVEKKDEGTDSAYRPLVPALDQAVHHAVNALLVPGDGVRRKHHRVAVLDVEQTVGPHR